MDHAPTAAERLRSLLRTASSLDVVAGARRMQLMDSHTIDADGRMLLAVPDDCALAWTWSRGGCRPGSRSPMSLRLRCVIACAREPCWRVESA